MRSPGGRLRLEEDRAVLRPDPGASFADLRPRPPAEAVGVRHQGVDPDLVLVRGGARRDEQLQVGGGRLAQPGATFLRGLLEHVDRLSRPIDAGRGQPPSRTLPELADSPLLADDHAGAPPPRRPGERCAPRARRDDVRADVAQGRQSLVAGRGDELPQPSPSRVLEVDALHGLLGTEVEDLLQPRLEHPGPLEHRREYGGGVPIHLRAEPGDYAEACLLPGDPLRAKYIAETFSRAAAGERRARHARLHRNIRGTAGLRAGERDGLPVRRPSSSRSWRCSA